MKRGLIFRNRAAREMWQFGDHEPKVMGANSALNLMYHLDVDKEETAFSRTLKTGQPQWVDIRVKFDLVHLTWVTLFFGAVACANCTNGKPCGLVLELLQPREPSEGN